MTDWKRRDFGQKKLKTEKMVNNVTSCKNPGHGTCRVVISTLDAIILENDGENRLCLEIFLASK
jgi:hypothetical protein